MHRSARQGTLSKTQKQSFAKSRQLAIDRNSCRPSSFRAFPSLDKRELTAGGDGRTGQAMVAEEETQLVSTCLLLQYNAIVL